MNRDLVHSAMSALNGSRNLGIMDISFMEALEDAISDIADSKGFEMVHTFDMYHWLTGVALLGYAQGDPERLQRMIGVACQFPMKEMALRDSNETNRPENIYGLSSMALPLAMINADGSDPLMSIAVEDFNERIAAR